MADEDDRGGAVPHAHYDGRELDRRFRDLGRALQGVPPEVQELLFFMRGRIEMLDRNAQDFVPRAEIERLADKRTIAILKSIGFDMDHVGATAAQVNWLMSLKRSVRGFAALMGVSTVGLFFTVFGSWLTNHLWSK